MNTNNANSWTIRIAGATAVVDVPSAHAVLEGLREGDWEPSDEVRGPGEPTWRPIEEHPAFADAVAEMGPPPAAMPDETRLDMNPLIDVSLVLLIFFILTTTYSTLRRSIELPPVPDPDGVSRTPVPKLEDVKDRSFRMKVVMDGTKPVITLDGRGILLENVDKELIDHVRTTGRKELFLTVTDDVPWGIEARIHDAAKGAGIHQIYWPTK